MTTTKGCLEELLAALGLLWERTHVFGCGAGTPHHGVSTSTAHGVGALGLVARWLRRTHGLCQDEAMVAAARKEFSYAEPPDVSHIVTEDDTPVDNFLSEKHRRLLPEILYSSWEGPRPDESGQPRTFIASADVGLFMTPKSDPLVPDVFVSLDVKLHKDFKTKRHRTYFYWEMGKPPDLVIEIVSNREGGELDRKLRGYARMRVPYYVVYDPEHHLGSRTLQAWELRGDLYIAIEPWFEALELGLAEWEGSFEGVPGTWLRWTRRDGSFLPTGYELAELASKRAESEAKRAESVSKRAESEAKRAEAEAARAEVEAKRAEAEAARAEAEAKRADAEAARAEQLAEKLRALGIEP
jgi:hypothetical protein